MTKLADKIEALEGPSREVDVEIALANGGFRSDRNQRGPAIVRINEDGSEVWPGYGGAQLVPTYTASLDAAMKLVPEKSLWSVCDMEDGPFAQIIRPMPDGSYLGGLTTGVAKTAVLALCAAALRAREANQ